MFEPKSRSLKNLLDTPSEGDSQSQFIVPRFQRKYEWEAQVATLIDDVFSDLGKQYFLGPVIFYPKGQKVEIIDGQQRLATFVILFRALVDYIQTRHNEGAFSTVPADDVESLKSDIRKLIIKGRRERVPVLRLSSNKHIDRDFRQEIVLNENPQKIENFKKRPKPEEHSAVRHLKNAYLLIFESLRKRYDAQKEAELMNSLQDSVDALESKQSFVVLTVNSYNDAYTIFETINARGKPLTLSNLVKILCFQKLHTETTETKKDETYLDELEDCWDDAEEQVSDFGAFIWHLWVSNYKSCRKKQVFTEIEKHFKTLSTSGAESFIYHTIFDEAVWYHEYENPHEISESDDITLAKKRYLEMLQVMGATRCYPLLLSIDYCVKENAITKEQANELLKKISCLTFWHSGVCVEDTRDLELVYHNLAQETRTIRMKGSKVDVNHVLDELSKKFPSQDLCERKFVSKRFDNSTFAKIILRNIQEKYQTGEKTLKGNRAVWLEHILPKSPKTDSEWKKVFEDEKERTEYVSRLGNQTLLFRPTNRALSNKDFSEKKKWYKDSELELTQEIEKKYDKWDKGAIEKRTKELFELAKQVWPIGKNENLKTGG